MLYAILFAAAGALLRLFDGTNGDFGSLNIRNGYRVGATIALSIASWGLALGWTSPAMWGAAWAALIIICGTVRWEDWGRQALQWSTAGLSAVWLIGPEGWPVPVAFLAPAIAYPGLFWLNARWPLPTQGWLDNPEAYARLAAGGAAIGSPWLIL